MAQNAPRNALIASELRYRRLFESAKDGILILDAVTGHIVDVNPFLVELLGYSHEQFVNKFIWDIGVFKDIIANRENFIELKAKTFIRYENLPLETSHGRRIQVEFVSNVYKEDSYDIIQCNIRDVTERKIIEGREHLALDVLHLLNSTDLSRNTIHNILLLIKGQTNIDAVGIRLKDGSDYPYYKTNGFSDGFVKAERSLCAKNKLGNFMSNTAGDPVLECMCGTIINGQTDATKPFFTQGGSFWTNSTTEYLTLTARHNPLVTMRSRCSGEGYESVALIPLRSDIGIIGLLQLNDHRKNQFSISMIKYFERLAASIGIALFRTTAAHERLKFLEETQRTQKLESIGLLAGGIAHDFNNLLSGILGYISLARDYAQSHASKQSDHKTCEKVSDTLGKALDVAKRAQDLTRQLLTFSKGGSPVKSIVCLSQLLINEATFALSGSKVMCSFLLADDLWPCAIDQNQVGQVINNIVINATQAMPDGGAIEIKAENVILSVPNAFSLKPGDYVKIDITDHGSGITEELVSKIFDPFFSTKQTGSGLGLSISLSIIRQHGGYIDVQSKIGEGTTFSIYFPALKNGIIDCIDHKNTALHKGTGLLLVMDDEDYIRDVAYEMLINMGYEVKLACNGEEAIALVADSIAAKHPFDAVILDLTIHGGMGGIAALKEMQKIYPGIKAIASSGYSSDPILANPLDYGFVGKLSKPYRTDELALMISSILLKT